WPQVRSIAKRAITMPKKTSHAGDRTSSIVWPSIIAGDGAELRRGPVGKIEESLVHVAPAPGFGRIVALDDGMPGGVEMPGRVLVGRLVAAAHMPAGPADAQMHPPAADLEAFLAAACARRDVANGVEM